MHYYTESHGVIHTSDISVILRVEVLGLVCIINILLFILLRCYLTSRRLTCRHIFLTCILYLFISGSWKGQAFSWYPFLCQRLRVRWRATQRIRFDFYDMRCNDLCRYAQSFLYQNRRCTKLKEYCCLILVNCKSTCLNSFARFDYPLSNVK